MDLTVRAAQLLTAVACLVEGVLVGVSMVVLVRVRVAACMVVCMVALAVPLVAVGATKGPLSWMSHGGGQEMAEGGNRDADDGEFAAQFPNSNKTTDLLTGTRSFIKF